MDYSGLCSFSISLTLPGSGLFHSNMVVLKAIERSRKRRCSGERWYTAILRGVKISLMKNVQSCRRGVWSLQELSNLGCFKACIQPLEEHIEKQKPTP